LEWTRDGASWLHLNAFRPAPLKPVVGHEMTRMNYPHDYYHIVMGIISLYAAARYTVLLRFLHLPPVWPISNAAMSHASRSLIFAVFSMFGVWQIARGLFHLEVSWWGAVLFFLSAVLIVASFLSDYFCLGRQSRNRK
jgi:hypothetical protein